MSVKKRTPSLLPPSPRQGFTLLELMVTITIVVLLFSISMPAYNLVKKRAYWAKTPTQMAKVITAFHAYSADHNGYYPPAYFPKGADTLAATLEDNLTGEAGWLNSTIFSQVYPDSSVSSNTADAGSAANDAVDSTGKNFRQNDKGFHLRDTVFEVQSSVLAFPKDENLYNHSFLLNRSLVTERAFEQDEFAPRKSTIFTELSQTMLLTEGLGGDQFNSISFGDTGGDQLRQGFDRHDGKFVHVGYMDGRVIQMKERDFPKSIDEDMGQHAMKDAAFIFWRGVTKREFDTLTRTGTGRVNY